MMIEVACDAIAPDIIMQMPVDELLGLKRTCRLEFNAMREWVEKQVSGWEWARLIENDDVLRNRLQQQYNQEFAPLIDQIRTKSGLNKWNTYVGALGVIGAPVTFAALGGVVTVAGLTLAAAPLAVAGVALYLSKVEADRRKVNLDMASQGATFLLKLEGKSKQKSRLNSRSI